MRLITTGKPMRKQWACNGRPLFYFARDSKAGEPTGDGFNQVSKTARP